ncbi:restriction endonuclease subunit S [Candidatus Gracilibacteria bacterium]|nr:restriction endonuclease subunit S [Candidatus Gracilibacteria bacterium]
MKLKPVKLSSLLSQVKEKHSIKNENSYKQVTVSNTGTISLRDEKMGIDIGTKNQFFIRKGQFIYSRLGLHTGAFGIVLDSLDGAVVTGDMPVFEIDNSKVLTDFLILSLDGDFFRNQLNGLNKGVAQSRIRESILLNLEILLPENTKKQEEILKKYNEFKSNYDNLSQISSNNLDYIKNLKQSILSDAIEGKLTKSWREQNSGIEPASVLLEKIKAEKEELIKQKKLKKQEKLKEISSDEIPFEIPKNWIFERLNEVSFVTKLAGFEYTKYINLREKGEIPVIRAQNVRKGYIDDTNLMYIDSTTSDNLQRSALYKKCLLMTFIGAGIGDTAIFDKERRFHLAPNVAKIEVFNQFNLNIIEEYLEKYLLSEVGRQQIFGFQKGGAQPNLSMAQIRLVIIPIPPLQEQKEIVKIVDELTKFCDELEDQTKKVVEKSEKLYKSFINKIGEYSEDEVKELLENSEKIKENIKETVKNNLSFKSFEEFVDYIESLQKKEETQEVKKTKKQVYNIKSSNMEILEILKDNKDGMDPLKLWQFSKHNESIEDFYDELKKLVKEGKIEEEKLTKGDEKREIILKLAK